VSDHADTSAAEMLAIAPAAGLLRVAIAGARAAKGRHRLPGLLLLADLAEAVLAERNDLENALREIELYPYDVGHNAEFELRAVKEIARAARAGERQET
jgi:hypothetical protein